MAVMLWQSVNICLSHRLKRIHPHSQVETLPHKYKLMTETWFRVRRRCLRCVHIYQSACAAGAAARPAACAAACAAVRMLPALLPAPPPALIIAVALAPPRLPAGRHGCPCARRSLNSSVYLLAAKTPLPRA